VKNELRALHHQAVNLDVCWDDGIRIKNAKKDTFLDRKKKMKGPKGYGFVRITNKCSRNERQRWKGKHERYSEIMGVNFKCHQGFV